MIQDLDVIILSETNLIPSINEPELCLFNFNVYRKDRDIYTSHKSSGGGVLIAVNKNLSSTSLSCHSSSVEHVYVSIQSKNIRLLVGAVYFPPKSTLDHFKSHCSFVESLLSTTKFSDILIAGDFNLPGAKWNAPQSTSDETNCPRAALVADTYASLGLFQRNFVYNSSGNCLDLVFSSNDNLTLTQADDLLLPEESNGYHPALSFNIELFCDISILQNSYYIYNYSKCNLMGFSDYLDKVDWTVVYNAPDVDGSYDSFVKLMKIGIELFVPKVLIRHSMFPRWVSSQLRETIYLKKIYHRNFKLTRSGDDYIKFSTARKLCKKLCRSDYKSYINHVQLGIPHKLKHFWNYVNTLKKTVSFPSDMYLDTKTETNPKGIADLFAQYFSSVFETPSSVIPQYNSNFVNFIQPSTIEESTILSKLKSLDTSKGPGPDSISPLLLKSLAPALAAPLAFIFNLSISVGVCPMSMKFSFITPIFKSGDRSNIRNYRPVTIESTLAKLLESCILDIIVPILRPKVLYYVVLNEVCLNCLNVSK